MESPSRPAPPTARAPVSYSLLLALGMVSISAVCWFFPDLMTLVGVTHGDLWFRDLRAVLVALDAQRAGLDPMSGASAHGRHNYSHWWLYLSATGWGRRDTLWLGFLICALGLGAAWLILRPRTGRALGCALLLLASPPLLLALNRANVDWLLFVLLSLIPLCLAAPARLARVAGTPLLVALGTGLKYFPAVAALLLLAVRPVRDRVLAVGLTGLLLVVTLGSVGSDLARYGGVVVHEGFHVFGVAAALRKAGVSGAWAPLLGTLVLSAAGFGLARFTPLRTWTVPAAQRRDHLFLILGAVVLTGCFLATVNYAYRWLFALWLLPFLTAPGTGLPPAVGRLRALTCVLLLLQVWVDGIVVAVLNLSPGLLEDLRFWERLSTTAISVITWLLFACLSGWLAHFALTELRRREEPDGRAIPPG